MVQVDEEARTDLSHVEVQRTTEVRLLRDGEERLKGRVLQRVVLKQLHGHGHANAVVRPQRGAASRGKQISLQNPPNGVPREVVLDARRLLTHHVQMRLKQDARRRLPARRGGLTDEDVVHRVPLRLKPQPLRPGQHVVAQRPLVSTAVRDLADLVKVPEHRLTLQRVQRHHQQPFLAALIY